MTHPSRCHRHRRLPIHVVDPFDLDATNIGVIYDSPRGGNGDRVDTSPASNKRKMRCLQKLRYSQKRGPGPVIRVFYRQTKRTAMGMPPAVDWANIYFGLHEMVFLNDSTFNRHLCV